MARSDNNGKKGCQLAQCNGPIRTRALGNSYAAHNHTFVHGYLSNCPVTYRFACGERFLYGKTTRVANRS